jgi:ABC-type transport system involved in cytochrome c biogenesis permease subunit
MSPKLTIEGLLIYLAMAGYLASAIARGGWSKAVAERLFQGGFAAAAAAFAYRWNEVGHLPLQSMFEVFLTLGMLAYPLSAVCRRFLGVRGPAVDALIGFVVLFPAGFVFGPEPQHLPPLLQSWIFLPHVAAYMLAYVIMAKAAVEATAHLISYGGPDPEASAARERTTYNLVRLGFPLLTLGLLLGALWANMAWGDYWSWDPKELWSLVSWLVYLGYLHARFTFGTRHPRLNSTLAVSGLAAIVITLLWVNLSKAFPGMHSYAS